MDNIFFASDHHFNHANILTFTKGDTGDKLRNFDSVEEMNETMITRHNMVVKPTDKVYFLGDVAMTKNGLVYLARMNGEKILIKGNHDTEKLSVYQQYFKDVRGTHQFEGIIFSHIPIHKASLGRWGCNVHGHLHSNSVTHQVEYFDKHSNTWRLREEPDPDYFCVCMEQINFTPISLEQLKAKIASRKESLS